MLKNASIKTGAIKIATITLLSFFVILLIPVIAQAASSSILQAESAVQQSQNTLDEARDRLNEITSEYESLSSEIQDMQNRIDELAEKTLEAQQAMLDGRDALSNTMTQDYKTSSQLNFIDVILGSKDLSSLVQNVEYISQIMDYQSQEISNQKKLREELQAVSAELNEEKTKQDAALKELEQKKQEAENVVKSAEASLSESSEQLESLKRQAESLQTPSDVMAGGSSESGSTSGSSSVSGNSSGSKPSGGSVDTSGDGWRSGSATAYGGSSDPNTPNPGKTAAGDVCDDWSMGVAVPMSWGNYKSYFGRTVQIVYNGMTVYATVNDCGGMRGGAVSLDLQPGVFKAFGFSTCQGWGIRTVQYRFL